jgi:DNA repair photolyase
MSIIYSPKGRAKEYGEYALNLYETCPHSCTYCSCPGTLRKSPAEFFRPARAKKYALDRLCKDLETEKYMGKEIFLHFIGDPFPSKIACNSDDVTATALALLYEKKCLVSILTKGGTRAFSCMHQIRRFGGSIKVGATLTFYHPDKSLQWEPGAALPEDRITMLRTFHEIGITTWASIEPVLEHQESIRIIMESLPYTDHYKIGKLNHAKSDVNWPKFLKHVVYLMRDNEKSFYIKKDLQVYEKLSGVILSEEEKTI